MNYQQLLSTVGDVHCAAQRMAGNAVNQLHVLRNWTVGCLIVEFEQHGEDRASYGEKTLKNLCADLASQGMTGLGLSTLKGCRTFYRLYPQIGQSAIGQFAAIIARFPKGQSPLGLFGDAATPTEGNSGKRGGQTVDLALCSRRFGNRRLPNWQRRAPPRSSRRENGPPSSGPRPSRPSTHPFEN